MKILNLHIHSLYINIYNNNNNNYNPYIIKPNSLIDSFSEKYILSFKCKQCNEFNNDYKSYTDNYFYLRYLSDYKESLFSTKEANHNFKLGNDIKIFEFVKFDNKIIVGTKNEIISYIYKNYNQLYNKYDISQKRINDLDSTIKIKEEDIVRAEENLRNEKTEKKKIANNLETIKREKMDLSICLNKEKEKYTNLNSKIQKMTKENNITIDQLENEKKARKELILKYSELQEQEKTNNIKNQELQEFIKQKEKEIINLTNQNKNLGNNVTNLKKNLNLKENEIKEINNSLNKEKNLKQEILKSLQSEKDKNQVLNNKLDNISIENNKNIRTVLNQLENEKKARKELILKYSELQEQEKTNNIKNQELQEFIKQKEKEIINLTNQNKNLGNNVTNLKKNLNLKENEIKEINNSLNKEKNLKQEILKSLQSEKDKNQVLNNKLDNISIENNKNIRTVLNQLENEKKARKELILKYSELQEQEKTNNIKNEELEKCLKNKDEELQNLQKNDNFGLKFESDSKSGDYDIILDITSFQDLVNKGWIIKYNKKEGKAQYLKKKEEATIIVGVIGNGNKGKSFFLEKLSGYDIPKGFNIKTEGLSIRYGTSQEHNVAILDSAGQETPLLKVVNEIKKNESITEGNSCSNSNEEIKDIPNSNSNLQANGEVKEANDEHFDQKKDDKNLENNNSQKKEQLEDEDIEFEKYSRDKLITEFFLQKFIIWKSDILILVVGNISLTEQKLLSRIKAEVESMDNNKQIYVIHNLKDYSTEEQINDYIENTLKKLYKIEIEEILRQKIIKDNKNIDNCFNKYFVEKGKKVIHLIFINDFSEKANYYNSPTIEFIQKEIEVIKTRNKFSIIEDCKNFIVKISEEIMEENPRLNNLVTEEGETFDKIILKNESKGITLKKFVVDEMGYTLNNDSNTPKYSYYINTEEQILYINIELPGGGSIESRIEIVSGYYIFIFEGEKKGDLAIEEDKKKNIGKLIQKKNLRKSNKFKLEIKIPNSIMQIKLEDGEELNDAGEFVNNGKGVYSFKYKVFILNQKNEKTKKKKKLEL